MHHMLLLISLVHSLNIEINFNNLIIALHSSRFKKLSKNFTLKDFFSPKRNALTVFMILNDSIPVEKLKTLRLVCACQEKPI